jgi:hypothetical protein
MHTYRTKAQGLIISAREAVDDVPREGDPTIQDQDMFMMTGLAKPCAGVAES